MRRRADRAAPRPARPPGAVLARDPHDGAGRRPGARGRLAGHRAGALRTDRRDRRRRTDRRAARRPRRPARARPHRRPVGQHGRRGHPRVRARRAHQLARRSRDRARAGAPGRTARRAGPAALPARRGGHARRRPDADRAGRAGRTWSGSSACTATRALDVGQVGLREGPITGAADHLEVTLERLGRAHLAPAPDRGPHLRARQGDHRAAVDPVAPPRPARRRERRLGHGPRGLGPQRHPGDRPAWAARCGCSTPSPGRRPRSWSRCWSSRSSRPTACTPRSTTSAVCRRSSTTWSRSSCLGHAVERVLGPAGHVPTLQSLGRRGLRLVPRPGAGRDGPPRARARRAGRRTTSTRATCASTTGPWASAHRCSPRSRSESLVLVLKGSSRRPASNR